MDATGDLPASVDASGKAGSRGGIWVEGGEAAGVGTCVQSVFCPRLCPRLCPTALGCAGTAIAAGGFAAPNPEASR